MRARSGSRRAGAFGPVAIVVCLASCRDAVVEALPPAGPPESLAAGTPASALAPPRLLSLLRDARCAAAAELLEIALGLPPGGRDAEMAWLLNRGDAAVTGAAIRDLDVSEVVRLRRLLRACARSADRRARDPALLALARAGEIDVLPLVLRALRAEGSEASLAAVAAAASALDALRPVRALADARDRARSPAALLAITRALWPDLDPHLHGLRAGGAAVSAALAECARLRELSPPVATWAAIGLTRHEVRALLDRASDPASAGELERLADLGVTRFSLERMLGGETVAMRPSAGVLDRGRRGPGAGGAALTGEALALIRARASELMAADARLEQAAIDTLAALLRGRGVLSRDAAEALGTIATPDAIAVLADALERSEDALLDAVSRSLAHALGVAPETCPEDPRALRDLWRPILDTLAR